MRDLLANELALIGLIIHSRSTLHLAPGDIAMEFLHGCIGVEDFLGRKEGFVGLIACLMYKNGNTTANPDRFSDMTRALYLKKV